MHRSHIGVTGYNAPDPVPIDDADSILSQPRNGYGWIRLFGDFKNITNSSIYLELRNGTEIPHIAACELIRYIDPILGLNRYVDPLCRARIRTICDAVKHFHKKMPGLRWIYIEGASYISCKLWTSIANPLNITVYKGQLQEGYLSPIIVNWYHMFIEIPLSNYALQCSRNFITYTNGWLENSMHMSYYDNTMSVMIDADNETDAKADDWGRSLQIKERMSSYKVRSYKKAYNINRYYTECPHLKGVNVTVIPATIPAPIFGQLILGLLNPYDLAVITVGPPADDSNVQYDEPP